MDQFTYLILHYVCVYRTHCRRGRSGRLAARGLMDVCRAPCVARTHSEFSPLLRSGLKINAFFVWVLMDDMMACKEDYDGKNVVYFTYSQ